MDDSELVDADAAGICMKGDPLDGLSERAQSALLAQFSGLTVFSFIEDGRNRLRRMHTSSPYGSYDNWGTCSRN